MDLTQYWLALKARRKAFFLVFLLTVVTAVVVTFVVPKRYDATATVLVDSPDEQRLATTERISPRERAGYMFTQLDLVRSGLVAHRVARELKLAQQPGMREAWERDTGGAGRLEDWIADQMLQNLLVDSGASNIVLIRYSARDPQTAATIANAFAKAYLETALEMRTRPNSEAATWFERQVQSLRTEVTQAQRRLAAYQKAKGIVGPDDRLGLEYTRLAEISAQLSAAKNATYEAESRYKLAREALARGPAAGGELPEIFNNPYLVTVKTALQGAEARLEEQGQVLGPKHPTYLRTRLEAQTLRSRLAAETKKMVDGFGAAAAQTRKREQELAAALAAQQSRILNLRDAGVELTVLTRNLDNAQRAYDLAARRYMETKMESQASKTNLAMLTPAIAPLAPAVPKPWLISALALVIGLLLAAGTVYLLEALDRKVRSRADLEQRLAVPSLGSLSRWLPRGGRLLPAPAPAYAGASRALQSW